MLLDKLQALNLELILTRLGMVVAVLVALWLLRRLLRRIILPRMGKFIQRSETSVDDTLLNAINIPLQLLISSLAIGFIGAIIWEPVPDSINNIARTLLIMAAFAFLYNLVGLITRSSAILSNAVGLKIDDKLLPFLRTAVKMVIIALAVVVILQEWDFDVAGLIAGLGVGGLAIALAAEETIANLFGFTTIVGDRTLAVGEYIVTPEVTGTVEHVGFRSTRIRQLDQAQVAIPNSKLASSVVTNWSRLNMRRMDTIVGLTYSTTSAQLREFMRRVEELLRSREETIKDSITVVFVEYGDSSLNVRVIAHIMLSDWKAFHLEQQEIMLQIMDIVEDMGLSFAFPSQSLYIEQLPQAARGAQDLLLQDTEQA
ncbi:MAG: mechanosensitive ion channel family protein [Anaerolineae bacterium]|nr:mechanosensitive ion channel family protein [Anaerolineae bacterium]